MAKTRDTLFRETLEEFGPMLNRIASAYEFDPDLRLDLVQEMALGLWQALPKFEGRSSLKTFVARIAHYRGIDHVARETRRPKTTSNIPEIVAPGPGLEHEIARAQENRTLVKAVQNLKLPLRQVATLALEGFEAREIAESLGITPNNAAVRLARAKTALKKELR